MAAETFVELKKVIKKKKRKLYMNMNEEEYCNNKGTTISHFYEKLLKLKELMNTEEAKIIAEKRHIYMEKFLKEFFCNFLYVK